MKDDLTIEEPDLLVEGRVAESRACTDGIEVDESIDMESIELHSAPATIVGNLGWQTVQPSDELKALFEDDVLAWGLGDPQDQAQQLADLEDEHLHLAAELAELRRVASEREAGLLRQLEQSRALLRAKEAELSDQEGQIASLMLECEGLTVRLGGHDHDAPAGAHAARSAGAALGDPAMDGVVSSLKQRLIERGHALTAAREEVERLERERATLAAALAARGSQVAKLLARLTRAAQRFHLQDEFKTGLGRLLGKATGSELDAEGLPLPGSEEPTVAIDEPPQAKAAPETTAPEKATPAEMKESPLQGATAAPAPRRSPLRERRVRPTAARIPAGQRQRRTDVGVRRYLIALDPSRDEVCELAERRMYVGRGIEADVRIPDTTASRLHAVLYLERGSTVVEDACSTNGVFVNLLRVRRAVLVDGDTVAFGNVRFQYRVGPAKASMD